MTGQSRTLRNLRAATFVAAALELAVAALVPTARAQSVSDFRLPPATSSPRPAGPVDSEHPVVAPTVPGPATAAAPTVSVSKPAPIRPPAPAQPQPALVAAPTAPTTPAPTPLPVPRVTATSAAPAAAPPRAAPSVPVAATTQAPARAQAVPPAPAPVPSGGTVWWWLLPAALAGALGFALVSVVLRRRDSRPTRAIEQPAQASLPRATTPPPARVPESTPEPPSAPVPALSLTLEPVRLSISLVNATLLYRLRLVNETADMVGPIALSADMIAAHASLSEDSQLGRDGAALEPRHRLAGLASGESAEISGELRLPLASIIPIRSGSAALLVPLVRLRIESGGQSVTRALVVGEAPVQPGGLLRPFRLDHGSRIFTAVSQRELAG